MKEVTNRFIDVYNYLMNNNYITNPSDFSKKIGISTSMMNEILKGRSNAGIKVIQNTVMEFNFINAEYLITGIGEIVKTKSEEKTNKKNVSINVSENDSIPKVQKTLTNEEIEKGVPVFYKDTAPYKEDYAGIPLIPIDAMAGFGEGDIHVMDYETSMYKVPEFEELRTDFMIRVKGSSMYPKYSSGDTVACKKLNISDMFFQWNKVYVLSTEQGAIIKRVKKGSDDEHILLVSENPSYEPFELHLSQIYAIAIVIGVIRME